MAEEPTGAPAASAGFAGRAHKLTPRLRDGGAVKLAFSIAVIGWLVLLAGCTDSGGAGSGGADSSGNDKNSGFYGGASGGWTHP